MTYAGNPSLAPDVKEKIASTFDHTLGLVTGGKDQEAILGCDFILQMDPQFAPAKSLKERLESDQRPVTVDDLRAATAPSTDGSPDEPLDALDDLDDLEGLDALDDLDDLDTEQPAVATPAAPPVAASPPPAAPQPASGLAAVLRDLLDKRQFQQILQIAETQKAAVERDPQVQELIATAGERLESEAFVQSFLKAAEEARAAGRLDEVENQLAKARALDPDHPGVAGFAAAAQPPAPIGDDDFLELQRMSLSLDSSPEEPPASDPRKTKPIAAMPVDDGAGDAASESELISEPAFETDDLTFDDSLEFDQGPDLAFDTGEDAAPEPLLSEDPPEIAALEPEPTVAEPVDPDPAAPPPPAESAAADGEDDRIAELLREGQESFDQEQYQAAIDAWSRIFLIDIENSQASRLIEEARRKKAELERQAEEIFHQAVGHLETDSLAEAKAALEQVVELEPGHTLANEYLEQLEAGKVPTVVATSDPEAALLDLDDDQIADPAATEVSMAAAVERDRMVAVKKTDKRMIALGAVVLLAAIGSIAYLVLKWDDLFPNQEPPPPMAQRQVDPIEKATELHDAGNVETALVLLGRIQPQDPAFEDAQALIAQWKAATEEAESAEPEDTGPTERELRRHALLVAAAGEAHKQGRHLRAREYYERAVEIMPLEPEAAALHRKSSDALAPIEKEIGLFKNAQYTAIIPELWRKLDDDPQNLDVQRLIVDSYYNLALVDLQRGNASGAAQKMAEALEVWPEDRELQRLQLFAQTYSRRPQDLLYRIFVKYLPSR